MLIKFSGGKIYDPANGIDGSFQDLSVTNGRIVSPDKSESIHQEFNLSGKVVMAGGIDPHSHIGGGKVTIARMLMPEDHQGHEVSRGALTRAGCGHAIPSTLTAGYRYAEMGYTAAFEPAMLPVNARQAHMEMADTPMIDKGAFVMLGSDDYFLRLLSQGKNKEEIKDYIAWTMHAAQALAVKVVNPGGISAFKFNQRKLDLDEKHIYYGITPRDIILSLGNCLQELGVPHPLHIHGCNLGVPGNKDTTLNTIKAAEGIPIHLTHIQFHSYGTEGDMKFSSGASEIAELVNQHTNVSIDIGQILFGQTCTASGDSMRQYGNTKSAHPKKWVVMDIECDAGCGVVPMKYRDKSFVNALQWAIGLEMFLLVKDPWRIFLTTDHPNGAPFTTYPHLIRLLMDKTFRNEMLRKIHPQAQKATILGSITREYSLYEIAIMTRAGPARSLGLKDRGHLGVGAMADITVYEDDPNRETMFTKPLYVFKNGEMIVRDGQIVKVVQGATHVVRPEYDRERTEKPLKEYFDTYHTVQMENFRLSDDEILTAGCHHEPGSCGCLVVQPTEARK
ncbi:MAG: formylmethanofuran dehydrogenase subunit A [Hyphomicrobium sp.]